MNITQFLIKILNGKIEWKSDHQRLLFQKFIAQFSDGNYYIEITERKSTRTTEQNSYYWIYLGMISEQTGYSSEDIHEWAKAKFLTKEIKELFGDKVRSKKSTTKLTKGEFVEYLVEISIATGIELPDTTEFYGYSYHK